MFSKPRADNDGFIWYGTYGGGLVRFDRIRKNYQRYLSRPGTPDALCSNRVQWSCRIPARNCGWDG